MPRPWVTIAMLAVAVGGCRSGLDPSDPCYQTVASDPQRDTELARTRNHQAKSLLADGKIEQAEKVLKQALRADMFFGPAHNNLGIAYLRQKKLYLAACEFDYAAKLMPNKAEPKNNLGLVMEQAGRRAEAETHYEKAVAAEPDNPEFIGNLARCRLRLGRRTPETAALLRQLVLKDTRPEWTAWARAELSRMPKESLQAPATQQEAPTSQPASDLKPVAPRPETVMPGPDGQRSG